MRELRAAVVVGGGESGMKKTVIAGILMGILIGTWLAFASWIQENHDNAEMYNIEKNKEEFERTSSVLSVIQGRLTLKKLMGEEISEEFLNEYEMVYSDWERLYESLGK